LSSHGPNSKLSRTSSRLGLVMTIRLRETVTCNWVLQRSFRSKYAAFWWTYQNPRQCFPIHSPWRPVTSFDRSTIDKYSFSLFSDTLIPLRLCILNLRRTGHMQHTKSSTRTQQGVSYVYGLVGAGEGDV
jgi:hypothetical protein